MNWNAILGIIGLSLLAFVAAFAVGRLHRPAPAFTTQLSPSVTSTSPRETLALAYPDELPPPEEAPSALDSTIDPAPELDEDLAEAPNTAAPAAPAAPSPAEVAAKKRAAENRKAIAARRAHADQLPDDFKNYYAQELPADAISSEQNVRATVAGERADVITLSSRAFNAENKNFVLQQVRSELEALGFKRVNITNDQGFKTSANL